jgi:Kef-type K+ transport system membrane component KefB
MKSMGSPADMKIAIMMAGIAVVLLAGILLGRLGRSLRQPVVIGEIAAGIILGPSVLGALPGDPSSAIFPTDVRPLLSAVSQVGLVLFMFLVGWEFEKRLIRPHLGVAAGVSICSVALSFGLGFALAVLLYPHHDTVAGHHITFMAFAMFMGAAMSVTAFPVLARILTDNRLTNTRVGAIAMGSAAVDDVFAWCMLAYVSALVASNGDYGNLIQIGVRSVIYVVAMVMVIRPLMRRLVWRWAGTERWRSLVVVLCAGVFLSSWLTTWIGIHAIFGAFLFGLMMPRQPARLLAEHLIKPLDNIGLVLMPVFFIVTGLGVDIGALTSSNYIELALIIGVACAGKILGTLIPAKLGGLIWKEAGALGLLMNTRGLTGLIILNAAVTLGVVDGTMFTMMVIMALVTTALAGPLLPRREVLEAPTAGAKVEDLAGSPT